MLYKEIKWTGSFYLGLKVSEPDEFDLNVVLNLPDEDGQIKEIEVRFSIIFARLENIQIC
jgi:hypothetical protein